MEIALSLAFDEYNHLKSDFIQFFNKLKQRQRLQQAKDFVLLKLKNLNGYINNDCQNVIQVESQKRSSKDIWCQHRGRLKASTVDD